MEKILLVVDMQNDFINGALANPEAEKIIPKVVEKMRNWDGDYIMCTQDTHTDLFYLHNDFMVEAQNIPPHCFLDSEGWKIHPDITKEMVAWTTTHPNPVNVIEKDTFIGFEIEYYINDYYQPKNPFEIHIVGLCTDICVISNALFLRSIFPCAKIVVDASCCAGTTPQQHENTLNIMKACCIDVI